MTRSSHDPLRAIVGLRGLEHAVLDPQKWAVEALHEAMVDRARRHAPPDDGATQNLGHAFIINEHTRTLLAYQSLWDPSPSIVASHRSLVVATQELVEALGLPKTMLNEKLFRSASSKSNIWVLENLLPLMPEQINHRSEDQRDWPLLLAIGGKQWDTVHWLIEHGASWDEVGRRVLTELPCDAPNHPFVSSRSSELWWSPLLDDEQRWAVLTTDVLEKEFDDLYGSGLAQARDRTKNPEETKVFDMVVGMARAMNLHATRNLLIASDVDEDLLRTSQHVKPSREVVVAHIFLNPPLSLNSSSLSDRDDRLKQWGLMPTPAEQEAIAVLQLRKEHSLSSLPTGWNPAGHRGKALWALLDTMRWNATTGDWDATGGLLMKHASDLQAITDPSREHPAKRWFNGAVSDVLKNDRQPSLMAERVALVEKSLNDLLGGWAAIDQILPGSTMDRSGPLASLKKWTAERLGEVADRGPASHRSEQEALLLNAGALWNDRLIEWADPKMLPMPAKRSSQRPRL